ncbi:hypothetical protein PHIN3_289 [Sinorhizobium phage phiN3]|uniref:Uncharacterized protein n=1 Tax=Sinorhizobium phage phiN3 TaxID=1647405 RepID=A0A0F6WCQ5_9CAUD|nr:hypothetical protein AVT40_gp244 [Sinorhizobium phage phiN3]AKF13552.1 hypothetical protein PHIN3_289 [Sinorhizobium phage phiN3]
MAKLKFEEDTLYIIRSKLEDDTDDDIFIYYESPNAWSVMLSTATIFRTYEIAEEHLVAAYNYNGKDGSITDIVPLRGEVARVRQSQSEQ